MTIFGCEDVIWLKSSVLKSDLNYGFEMILSSVLNILWLILSLIDFIQTTKMYFKYVTVSKFTIVECQGPLILNLNTAILSVF